VIDMVDAVTEIKEKAIKKKPLSAMDEAIAQNASKPVSERRSRTRGQVKPNATSVQAVTSNYRKSMASVTSNQYWAHPNECTPWKFRNRSQHNLNFEACEGLIESIKANGQKMPIVVCELPAGSNFKYEIITGARRHWACTHLKIKILIDVRKFRDLEEKFLLQDVENRDREDISALERALDYAGALKHIYSGDINVMANKLSMHYTTLKHQLDMALLPEWLIKCYENPNELSVRQSIKYHQLLKDETRKKNINQRCKRQIQKPLPGRDVFNLLTSEVIGSGSAAKKEKRSKTITGSVVLESVNARRKAKISFDMPKADDESALQKLRKDLDECIAKYFASENKVSEGS